MYALRVVVIAACLFLVPNLRVFGQSGRGRFDCPRPVKERAYRAAPKAYMEVGVGLAKPILYRNGAGYMGEHYRFNSLVLPYASVTGFLVLGRLEVFAGVAFTESWQGMRFLYEDRSGSLSLNSYAGSAIASVPVGIRYRVSQALALSAGPYISYSMHSGYDDETVSGGNGESFYSYRAPDDYSFNGGLRVAADIRISKRLSAVVSCSADAGKATASYATADLRTGGAAIYQGTLVPYLLHPALGISYRLWYRE